MCDWDWAKKKRGVISSFTPRLVVLWSEEKSTAPAAAEIQGTGTPQQIALRLAMGMRQSHAHSNGRLGMSIVTVAVAICRRGLRHPRRITDRAESGRHCMDVIADRLQPLQYRLPLFPIQLPQERPQSLDERILQQRFAVGFRNEEAVQADVNASEIFSSVPRLGVICPLSMRDKYDRDTLERDCSWLCVIARDSRN